MGGKGEDDVVRPTYRVGRTNSVKRPVRLSIGTDKTLWSRKKKANSPWMQCWPFWPVAIARSRALFLWFKPGLWLIFVERKAGTGALKADPIQAFGFERRKVCCRGDTEGTFLEFDGIEG
jgi:hypothetical protein